MCEETFGYINYYIALYDIIVFVTTNFCECLEKRNTLILINLQRRKHTYLYSSVRAKKETKLESN